MADQNEQDGWPMWPDVEQAEQVANNILLQHPDQPQDTISFDQSGSTAEYLRAIGPDIILRVEDICNIMHSASSSDSSVDSAAEVHSDPSFLL